MKKNQGISALSNFVITHPWWVLLLSLSITLLMAAGMMVARFLPTMLYRPSSNLPKKHGNYRTLVALTRLAIFRIS
jgi:uncharacterized membrane protein YdfJ with MMPL/SSD domain